MTETIEELLKGYIRHKYSCDMGEYNSICEPDCKGCTCGLAQALALSREKCVCNWEWDGKHKAWVTPHRKVGTVNLKCYTFKGDDCPTCSKRIEETPQ